MYRVNLSNQNLTYVVESDLAVFNNLETLNVSENKLNFARLGALPGLKRLIMSLNDVKSLDLDVSGRFMNLTSLDLSFNSINESAQILLATLPCLQSLDLTCNNIATLSNKILDVPQ